MKKLSTFNVLMMTLFVAACSTGTYSLTGGQPNASNDVVCVGNPDQSVVCGPLSDFWDCTALPNGEVKCTRPGAVTPGGSASWSCIHDGVKVSCTTTDDVGSVGSGGWDCVTEGDMTTCVSTTGADVPGGGSWTCMVDVEFGLTCEGTPTDTSGSGSSGGDETSGGGSSSSSGGGEASGSSGGEDSSGSGSGSSSGGEESDDNSSNNSGESNDVNAFPCSYAMIVFVYEGETYVVKVPKGWTTCTFTNQTSSDAIFEYSCNGDTYSNPDFVFSRNGSPVTPFPGSVSCEELLTVEAGEVSAKPGVTIIYAAAHNGSFEGHFASLCPPPDGTDHLTFPDSCS